MNNSWLNLIFLLSVVFVLSLIVGVCAGSTQRLCYTTSFASPSGASHCTDQ